MAIKRCFLLVCGFLSLTVLSAQGLPKMPVDPDLVHGTLPNGTSYYVMSNPSLSAHADFAIVSRTGRSTTPSPEQVERISREFLSSSRRIGNRTVQDFMLANGASYGKDGFVSVRENATIVRFSGVSTAKLDSVLLVIFDVIDKVSWSDDEFLCRWYAPSDQAVIICGDVDAPSVISKMRMLSMMTPAMESVGRPEYVMDQSDKPFLTVAPGASDKISEFTISWSLPRTPREYMNTVQPVVYEKFVSELGYLASSLIKRELRYKGIPYADVSWKYVAGVETESAELFSLSLAVGPEDMKKAVETAAKVLSCIDSGRISEDDYKVARQRYLVSLSEEETDPVRRNQEYFNRCLSSFLYGAHLFSDKDKLSFLSSKQMEQKAEVALFADVAAAIIDSSRNVTLSLNHPSGKVSTEEMSDIFNAAWNDEEPLYLPQRKDSLVWNWPTPKVMLKSSRKDHLSGGQIWTFSNGFRVIYRKQPSSGRLYYSLALNGGFGSIKGLEKGEGAYFPEYLPLCRIGGMDGEQFVEHLLMEGMTLNTQVNLSNTIISGSLPKEKMSLMTHALLAIANTREHDESSYDGFVANQKLLPEYNRGTLYAKMAAVDSIICPDYTYSIYKGAKIDSSTGLRSDDLFNDLSTRMNDGVLVIVGDVDEIKLRKHLLSVVGGFRTREVAFARPVVSYHAVSGWSTYTVKGNTNSIDVVMSMRMPLTADNYAAASVAAFILKHHIEEALAGTGTYVRVSSSCSIYPQERFNVMLSVRTADTEGFVPGTSETSPMEILSILRTSLSELDDMNIPDAYIQAAKRRVKGQTLAEMSSAGYWLKAIVRRHLDGKNFTTGYESKVDAVTSGKVRTILSALNSGSKVEYIERKR